MNWLILRAVPWRWRIIMVLVVIGWGVQAWRGQKTPKPEGLAWTPFPAIVELSPEEMNERLAFLQRRSISPEIRCRRLAMKDLGIIREVEPPLTLKDDSWLERVRNQLTEKARVEAFYVVGRDTLYVLSKTSPAIAHELVHAWEDQKSDRMKSADTATTDAQIAKRAVIEGTAIMAAKQPIPSLKISGDLDENAWSLAYTVGPKYVEKFGGQDPANWLALKPEASYDVMYDRVKTRPEDIPMEVAPGRRGCSDRLGALAVLTAARAYGAAPADGLAMARAWKGDRLEVEDKDGVKTIKWAVVFSDSLYTLMWNGTIKFTQALPKDRVTVYGLTTARTLASMGKDSTLAKRPPLTR